MKLNTVLKGTIKSTEVYIAATAIELANYGTGIDKIKVAQPRKPFQPLSAYVSCEDYCTL